MSYKYYANEVNHVIIMYYVVNRRNITHLGVTIFFLYYCCNLKFEIIYFSKVLKHGKSCLLYNSGVTVC